MWSAAAFVAATAAYILAGRFGLSLAFVHASATAVWPPTGIAIATLLLLGHRFWPAILIGAFVVNVTATGAALTSIAVAVGNTLEAMIAAALVQRFGSGVAAFDRAASLFRFLFITVLFATPVSATIGVTSLAAAGEAAWSDYGAIWLTWWIGDVVGACLVTPVILLWARTPRLEWSLRRAAEAALLLGVTIGTAIAVFGGGVTLSMARLPVEFLCIPPALWAAFRFGSRETATSMVLLGGIALWGTTQGFGPFAGGSIHRAIVLLQLFIGVVGVMVLAVAALVAELRATERHVRALNDVLEQRVADRTARLESSYRELLLESGERTRAEHERERTEARLLEAQRVARIGSWEWDIAENRIWWSDELYRIFGIEPSSSFDASYESYLGRVHPADRGLVDGHIRQAFADGESFSFEHRLLAPDASVRWVAARGDVIRDASGTPVRMAGTGQDVTEWKRLEQERTELFREQAARQEAEEANRLKDEFLATLSHELRTPLNAIVGWLQILRGRPVETSTRQTLDVIERNAAALRRLIEDVLDVSAIASGKLKLSTMPLDFRRTVAAAVDSMRPAAAARGIAVEHMSPDDLLPLAGDAQRLHQVVANLLANAVKFTPSGGRIHVEVGRDGQFAFLRVSDSGAGIRPDVLPYVFDRFRQGDSSVTRAHGGLGLGLAIVRHMTQLHGGTVAAASGGEGRGAVFTVRLPLLPGGVPERETLAAAPRVSAEALSGVNVLVVDDDPDARELLATGLAASGADVTTAASVRQALRELERRLPHLLLVDIAMPGEDGYALLREIRQRGLGIAAIAVTAHAGPEWRRKSLDAGFIEHIDKPVDLDRLIQIMTALAAAYRQAPPAVPPQAYD